MSLVQVRYTRTYTPDNSGLVPTFARPTFTLSGVVTDGVSETLSPASIVCTVNASGQLVGPDGTVGVLLYALDKTSTGTAVSPAGATYSVSGEPGLAPWTLAPVVSDGPTRDLATVAPALTAAAAFSYATSTALSAEIARAEAAEATKLGPASGVPTSGQVPEWNGTDWVPATLASVDQAWQFRPESYGAKGDGKVVSDVATNATNTFTSATIAANGSVGQWVLIDGARGTGDYPAIGTITAINTGTNAVTISPLVSNGVTFTPNATAASLNAVFGTDDTAAINSALSAANTYAQAHDYYAEVLFKDKIYIVAGLTQTANSPAYYNTQLLIPYPTNNSGRKLVLGMMGVGRTDHLQYWNSTVPNLAGTVIFSMQHAPNAIDGTYGPQSIIGAVTGTAGLLQGGTLSPPVQNTKAVIENIQVCSFAYTNLTGFDLTLLGGCYVDGCSAQVFAQPLDGNGVLLNSIWSDQSVFGGKQGTGIRLPTGGNNADVVVPSISVEGYTYGVNTPSEHTWIGDLKAIYVAIAIQLIGSGATGHGLAIGRVTAEAYQGGINLATGGAGKAPISIAQWSTEASGGTIYDVNDAGNALLGEMHFFDIVDGRSPIVTGAAHLRVYDDRLAAGHQTAPGVPATTVALTNPFWRDCAVTVTGGTVTAIAVDGTATGLTSGTVIVPTGKTITLTYSAVPSWNWLTL